MEILMKLNIKISANIRWFRMYNFLILLKYIQFYQDSDFLAEQYL